MMLAIALVVLIPVSICLVVLIQRCRILFKNLDLATVLPITACATFEIIYFPTRIANAVTTHIHWARLGQ
jgi:hypothetical protein